MSRFAYFSRETTISLRRNLMMTLAGILTVTVSLFLFGGIWLVSRLVDHGTEVWKGGVEFEIFMNVDATDPQEEAIRQELDDSAQVKSYEYFNKQAAYQEFLRIFRDNPELTQNITAEDLPTSFRVVPVQAEFTDSLVRQFQERIGVKSVNSAQDAVRNVVKLTNVLRVAFFAIAAVLLASSLFLIVNTIRLATFARRREIEVMKLVGASNWFVRVPFMAEGVVQGAVGAGIATGLVYGLKTVLTNVLANQEEGLFSHWYLNANDPSYISLWLVVIGVGIGLIGSMVGLRRFLEV